MNRADNILIRRNPSDGNGEGNLRCSEVARAAGTEERDFRAANSLARGRVKTRLLWISVVVLGLGHLVIPIALVATLSRPEKVALMDGTESLIISPLVPVEDAAEIRDNEAYWGSKALLDRNPEGFDAPETLNRVFSPVMEKKAQDEFSKAMREQYKEKQLYQTLKVARIDQQKVDATEVVVTVVGQVLTTAAVGDEPVTEPTWVKLNLKMQRNPYLGRNRRYPYMVVDYWYGTPEKISVTQAVK
jgi:hypothetical protein